MAAMVAQCETRKAGERALPDPLAQSSDYALAAGDLAAAATRCGRGLRRSSRGDWQRRSRAWADRRASQGNRTVNVLPLPSSLSKRNLAAQQLAQLADDRQAQARCPSTRGSWRRRRRAPTCPGGTSRRSRPGPPRRCRCPCRPPSARRSPRPSRSAADDDPAPLGRELDRVGEQVVEDLLHLARVLEQDGQVAARSRHSRSMFFRSASGRAMSHWAVQTSRCGSRDSRTSILPLSILARSRMSLIISSSILPEVWMFCT